MELFTACCRYSQLLLKDDEHKKIVLQSLAFLCSDQRIRLFGYVILDDEFHVLWEKLPAWKSKNIRQMMLKFTAQQIKHRLLRMRSPLLEEYKSTLNDRRYHFWDKATYFTPIRSLQMANETIYRLHEAPVSSGLCAAPEEYPFSSAGFYHKKYGPSLPLLQDEYGSNIHDGTATSHDQEATPVDNKLIKRSTSGITSPRFQIIKTESPTASAFSEESGEKEYIGRVTTLVPAADPEKRQTINKRETTNLKIISSGKNSVKLIYKSLTAGNNKLRESGDPGLIALIARKAEEPLIITDFQMAFTSCYVGHREEE